MKLRLILLAALAAALSGCSYDYELRAFGRDGAIVIEPTDRSGRACLSSFSVESLDGIEMWDLVGTYRDDEGDCAFSFPLTYGIPPAGSNQLVPAKPLEAGVTYKMIGSDGDSYTGSFKFHEGGIVENVKLPPGSFASG